MAYATTTGACQAYLQLPSWLSSSVYELQSTPTGYGWTYNYRVYNGTASSYIDEPETSMVLHSTTPPYLIARDLKITSFDVSESSRTGVSLMHSAAVVPTRKGTPLVSVIGGALCYLSPDVSFFHWDNVFQGCIQKWVSNLQESGVDLMLYGEQESINISKHFRTAFDSDAIEASRNEVRNVLPSSSARLTFIRPERSGRKMWNNNHWIPIRLLELKFGPTPSEWEIVWVPEFEWVAKEFWQMIEQEVVIMPGSWID
ncbi:hypothetical protein FPANT_11069 [Fusarium pseudoanthophilum]|uniref:Uncharacterized protein n=1 Tax=Fusarium pseudoanthophilum TaxID=48495 RepID=A0A8H5NS66_9HYPO|nr:hypothetical protein FPANT_11069 [Fusarium pseudoanthophilum]